MVEVRFWVPLALLAPVSNYLVGRQNRAGTVKVQLCFLPLVLSDASTTWAYLGISSQLFIGSKSAG
jgi:hypothetical protein